MSERIDEALLKEILGEPLCERELMIVQWFRNGEGCAACNSIRAAAVVQPYKSAIHRRGNE